jgi:Ulp1 family protease
MMPWDKVCALLIFSKLQLTLVLRHWLLVEHSHPDQHIGLMETFFYSLLESAVSPYLLFSQATHNYSSEQGLDCVKKWMKIDTFFSLRYLLIPIHVGGK